MKTSELNRQLAAGHKQALALETKLARIYAAQLRQIAAYAADRFSSLAVARPVTAAGDDGKTPDWVPPDVDELLNQPLADAKAEKAAEPVHLQAIRLATPDAVKGLGISFEADSPFAKPLLEQVGTKGVNLGLAARDVILKVIGESYTAGLSVPDTAAALQSGIAHLATTTALMQARTDLNGLANGASVQSVQLLGADGPGYKTWLATEDERTRETHADADGQQVPVDQPFQVGDDLLMYPGDPDGSDAEIINCRCTVVYDDAPEPDEVAAAGAPNTAGLAMVAVYPRQREAEALAVDGGQDADTIHCTLIFLGEADSFDQELAQQVVQTVAEQTGPLAGMAGGVGHFAEGPDGYPSIVLPDVQGLSTLQETLRTALAVAGIESPSEHGFTPHMTVGYADEPTPADPDNLGAPLHFDSLSLTIADDRTDYPLMTVPEIAASAVEEDEMRDKTKSESTETTPLELGVFAAAAGEPIPWRAILLVEGEVTADGRIIDPGAIDWRRLPLTLMAMIVTDEGHDGAQVAGRIDNIYRDPYAFGDGRQAIVGEGVFDTGEYGAEIARLVADQTLRGVSVDLGSVEIVIQEPSYDVGEDEYQVNGDTDGLMHYAKGTIMGATVCPFQAIESGAIEIAEPATTASADALVRTLCAGFDTLEPEGLTAAAAGATLAAPPGEWFEDPRLDGPTALTIEDDGRVFGHVAPWNVCHIGNPQGPNVCTTAPRDSSGYSLFHLGEIITAEGDAISVGQVTLDTDHAPLGLSANASQRHYADTGVAACYGRCGMDAFGIWFAGALAEDLPASRLKALRAAKLSGDWRRINGKVEMIGVLGVNIPGFPIPRAAAQIRASGEIVAMVAAGIIGEGKPTEEQLRAKVSALAARVLGRDALLQLALGDEYEAAPAGALVWDSEQGVMDIMSDISALLNPGDSYRWWVTDLAIGGGSAIICDGDENEYWLVPVAFDSDGEPVLPPTADWIEVESEWRVEDSETSESLALRSMAARHALPAAPAPKAESRWANRARTFFAAPAVEEPEPVETLAAEDAPVVVTETAARDPRNPALLSGSLDDEIALQVSFLRDHGYYSDEPLSQTDLNRAELREAQRLASFLVIEPNAIQSVALQSRLIDKGLLAAAGVSE